MRLKNYRITAYYLLIALSFFFITPAIAENRPAVKSLLEMRQDRVVVQKWDLSCGAAALATILNYQHLDPVEEKEIANALIQREEYIDNPLLVRAREGFSLLDLKRYVDNRGYKGIGFGKLELTDLIERAPVMVPLNLAGYNHFVIFRGMKKNRVLVADPAWGNRTFLIDNFLDAWIEYPKFGKVGFVVASQDDQPVENRLAPRPKDFVFLR
jgi:predicted double-glycine peptidase